MLNISKCIFSLVSCPLYMNIFLFVLHTCYIMTYNGNILYIYLHRHVESLMQYRVLKDDNDKKLTDYNRAAK